MELFNKKYVHFMWDDSLACKDAFFSSNIDDLRDYVNKHKVLRYMIQSSGDPNYPFSTGNGTGAYKFVYYDPNYKYKEAFIKGDTVEMLHNKSRATWLPAEDLDDLDDPTCVYRIKKSEKKEDKEELVTYEELAEWLTKGSGLVMDNAIGKVSTALSILPTQLDDEVSRDYLIRRYGEKEWHKPTKKYVYNK